MNLFQDRQIVLGSQSPRRKELLALANIPFIIRTTEVNEDFPPEISVKDLAPFLSEKKSKAIEIHPNEILITADTIVSVNGEPLGKPKDATEAKEMLDKLSDKMHEVITAFTLRSLGKTITHSETTLVRFKNLSVEEISYYVSTPAPLDKAGAYGIQDWIGLIGIKKIDGCYYNVVGMPMKRLYSALINF